MTTTARMTGAEFAVRRHMLGLTLDELAAVLGVNPRTTRSWEAERDQIPARLPAELDALTAEHTKLAQEMIAAGSVQIVRAKHDDQDRPRGWYVAAAARATAANPGLRVEWIAATSTTCGATCSALPVLAPGECVKGFIPFDDRGVIELRYENADGEKASWGVE